MYKVVEMKKLFLKGVSEVVGKSVEYPKWFEDGEDSKDEPEPAKAAQKHAQLQRTTAVYHPGHQPRQLGTWKSASASG